MVAELGAILSRLILHRKAREFPEALSAVDRACRQLLGADAALLGALSDNQLIEFYGRDPNTAPARWYVAGTLLVERAEILRDMEKAPEAQKLEVKGLVLLLESIRLEDAEVQPDHVERIHQTLERLVDVSLSRSVAAKVAWYRSWREAKERA